MSSDDSDIEADDDLSEHSGTSVPTDQLWHDSRSKERVKYIILMLTSQVWIVMLHLTSVPLAYLWTFLPDIYR